KGDGQYTNLAEALQKAQPGARIHVKPGVYKESLNLDKKVEIIGEGKTAEIVIESASSHCLLMRTDSAVIRGVTFRCRAAASNKTAAAVDIAQGQLILDQCDITSDTEVCVAIHGAGTNPVLSRCRVFDGKGVGVDFYAKTAGKLENCELMGHAGVGARIREEADPILRECKISENKSAGVFVYDHG